MTTTELLATLQQRGVILRVEGDRLRVDAPKGTLSADDRAALTSHKAHLIAALTSDGDTSHRDEPTFTAATAAALGRLREGLSRGLRRWEDERLLVLVGWHLALAFGRGGAGGFRRHLPPSLRRLTDEDLAALVDWATLATLEKTLWKIDPDAAERLSRGAQRLAAWCNARAGDPAPRDTAPRGETPTAAGIETTAPAQMSLDEINEINESSPAASGPTS